MQTVEFKVDSKYIDMVLNLLNSINKLRPNTIQELSIIDNSQPLSENEIKKIVENSQRIEGYEPVSKEFESKVEAFMVEHNVKISA